MTRVAQLLLSISKLCASPVRIAVTSSCWKWRGLAKPLACLHPSVHCALRGPRAVNSMTTFSANRGNDWRKLPSTFYYYTCTLSCQTPDSPSSFLLHFCTVTSIVQAKCPFECTANIPLRSTSEILSRVILWSLRLNYQRAGKGINVFGNHTFLPSFCGSSL